MTRVTVLPHEALCPEGIRFDAEPGTSICDSLLDHGIEIGAGLGPLAGKVFRVGLMGTSSSQELVDLLADALQSAMKSVAQGLH